MFKSTVIPGLYSAPINRPHLLIFKRKKKLYINKPRLSISRRCPRDCGQASRHSRLCGQISRHGNSTAPIILTFTVNTSKPPRMGRWGQESSVRGTTSGFHSSLHSVSLSFALSMSLSSRGKSALELALSSSSRRVYTGRWSAVLRRATLHREAPRCAVLRNAALCRATLRCAVLRYTVKRRATLRCAALRRATLRCEAPCYAALRCAVKLRATPRYAALCRATLRCEALRCAALRREAIVSASSLFSPLAASVSRQETHWKMSCMCDHGGRNRRMTGVGKCDSGVNSQSMQQSSL